MKREASLSPPPLKRRRLQVNETPLGIQSSSSKPAATTTPPPPRTIRIMSWNINGLQAFIPASAAPITSYFKALRQRGTDSQAAANPGPHNSLRAFLARHDWPEVLFLQELKISPASEPRLSAALLAALNDEAAAAERSYTADMVLPCDRFNARGFQGRLYGVGTLLRTDFARRCGARARAADWDLEGRVSVVETTSTPRRGEKAGSVLRPLALVNVYAVNGTSAPYRNPRTGEVEGTRHDHKLAFHSRLRDEAMDLEARGFDVVIAGDLNVARGPLDGHPNLRTYPAQHCRNRADFNAKLFGGRDKERARAYLGEAAARGGEGSDGAERCLDGVDVFRALHGAERRYTYHPRTKQWGTSADRVDLIIASKRLWEEGRVRRAGILDTPQERGPSDHVPLWVEIAME